MQRSSVDFDKYTFQQSPLFAGDKCSVTAPASRHSLIKIFPSGCHLVPFSPLIRPFNGPTIRYNRFYCLPITIKIQPINTLAARSVRHTIRESIFVLFQYIIASFSLDAKRNFETFILKDNISLLVIIIKICLTKRDR